MAGGKDCFAGETTGFAGAVLSVYRLIAAILCLIRIKNEELKELKKEIQEILPHKEESMRGLVGRGERKSGALNEGKR